MAFFVICACVDDVRELAVFIEVNENAKVVKILFVVFRDFRP